MGHSSALLLLSVLCHCFQFEHERIWPGESRHCICTGEGHYPVRIAWGRGAASCPKQLTVIHTFTHWWWWRPCEVPSSTSGAVWVQYLAQGHFNMQTSNLLITMTLALPQATVMCTAALKTTSPMIPHCLTTSCHCCDWEPSSGRSDSLHV